MRGLRPCQPGRIPGRGESPRAICPRVAARAVYLQNRHFLPDDHTCCWQRRLWTRRFAGTCYRTANWQEVGSTLGYGGTRGGALGYVAHGQPKRVFLDPLRRDATRS